MRRIVMFNRVTADAYFAGPNGGLEWVLGSGSIVSQLTAYGLIDEYQFLVSPIFLGHGRPLFQEVSTSSTLNLLEAKSYRSGNVMLHYARAG